MSDDGCGIARDELAFLREYLGIERVIVPHQLTRFAAANPDSAPASETSSPVLRPLSPGPPPARPRRRATDSSQYWRRSGKLARVDALLPLGPLKSSVEAFLCEGRPLFV